MHNTKSLYLDLMKKCLTYDIYGGEKYRRIAKPKKFLLRKVYELLSSSQLFLVRPFHGDGWPLSAQTMIGPKRLDNLQFCVEKALANNTPGDLIEAGVWRGGASIFMRAILKAYCVTDRRVWVADSFQGLPPPTLEQDRKSTFQFHMQEVLAVSIDEVKSNFRNYGLLDEQVCFLEGWFHKTLPTVSDRQWAVVRLDSDLYESTMDGLRNLYPGISLGGYIIIDDYGAVEGCRQAVQDYRTENNIREEIQQVDWTCIFWKRTR